jgi:hypothetical protein
MLLAPAIDQMYRPIAVLKTFEIQGDADAISGAGTPITIERECGHGGNGLG